MSLAIDPARKEAVQAIESNRGEICAETVALHFERVPELRQRYSARGHSACLEDCGHHLDYLVRAVEMGEPRLFGDYVLWARRMLDAYGVPADDLKFHLICMATVLKKYGPDEGNVIVQGILNHGVSALEGSLPKSVSFMDKTTPQGALAENYLQLLLGGKRHDAARLILQTADEGVPVRDLYLNVFQPAQYEIGRLWQLNKITVTQEHYCTAATQLIMSQLYPRLFAIPRNGRTVVTACVGGELHELGIRMVSDFFEMDGWDSFYLGANTPVSGIIKSLVEQQADVLAISTTITKHVSLVSETVQKVRASDASKVKILVGGYPFNLAPDLWKQIGADGCASNAEDAVRLATQLLSGDSNG